MVRAWRKFWRRPQDGLWRPTLRPLGPSLEIPSGLLLRIFRFLSRSVGFLYRSQIALLIAVSEDFCAPGMYGRTADRFTGLFFIRSSFLIPHSRERRARVTAPLQASLVGRPVLVLDP